MLNKTIIKSNFENELLNNYKDYRKYEITVKAKLSSIASLTDRDRISYIESQLHHVIQRFNEKIIRNYRKPHNTHLNIKSFSVVERHNENGQIHLHSIFAVHKDAESNFLSQFRFDGIRYFVKDELMESKFNQLCDIECQQLNDELDVMTFVDYMLKHYIDSADREGRLNDSFCFVVHPIPSNIKNKNV